MRQTFQEIDLSTHAVIEASAGTGKTYTIENLVLRILEEEQIEPEELVIVTFTEKATGELKERIKESLQKRVAELPPETELVLRLKECLENFENFQISTIHGFCNRILKEYAFENRGAFAREIVDNKMLYPRLLHKQMKKQWVELYGEWAEPLIALSSFPTNPQGFEEEVIKVASNWRPHCNDRIIPEPLLDMELLSRRLNSLIEGVERLVELVEISDSDNPAGNFLYKRYRMLEELIDKRKINSRLNNIILPLLNLATFLSSSSDSNKISVNTPPALNHLALFLKTAGNCSGFKANEAFDLLLEGNLKKGQDPDLLEAIHSDFSELIKVLNTIYHNYRGLNKLLVTNTAFLLLESLSTYKSENSLLSFDDMLYLVNRSLEENPGLLALLQAKYRYALVDEFQDTDLLQWEIFKKIFMEDSKKKNKLLIIGDPKQSIYRFRNADVETYLKAKNTILKATGRAEPYTLDTNFRTVPGLIDDLNQLFSSESWFTPGEDEMSINYSPVNAQSDDRVRKARVVEDKTGRRELCLVKMNGEELKKSAKEMSYLYSGFVVDEIERILADRGSFRLQFRGGEERPINENDICIIVRQTKEAVRMEELLRQRKIKAKIYKRSGLYQSNEALHLKYLLTAIAYPENREAYKKALLTHFFDIRIEKLSGYIEPGYNSLLIRLLEKWQALSERRLWGQLFESIMEDTGFVFRFIRHEELYDADAERVITNYYHIMENLEEAAYRKNMDIHSMLDYLINLIKNRVQDSFELDLHRLETEEDKVQIMTIHASKGLEFPFVFIYGGFTTGNTDDYYKFHSKEDDNNNNIVYDLLKLEENKALYEREEEEEEKRLYYVALTRAIFKLYLPYLIPQDKRSLGAMGKFVGNAIKSCFANELMIEPVKPESRAANSIHPAEEKRAGEEARPELQAVEVALSSTGNFRERKITLQSFSSLNIKLKVHSAMVEQGAGFGDDGRDNDEEMTGNEETPVAQPEEITLPGGSFTGDMFHAILENIDFERVGALKNWRKLAAESSPELGGLIEGCFEQYLTPRLRHAGEEQIKLYKELTTEIVYTTLTSPLNSDGFKLCGLTPGDKIHEVEFYLPLSDFKSPKEGYLTGFIDLVFRIGERYYLLDWKSNFLESYVGEEFRAEVAAHYELQYNIYMVAYLEWLKRYIRDFNYEKHFGGTYYLYLRGLGKGEESGIFYYRPEEGELAAIKRDIGTKIKEALE